MKREECIKILGGNPAKQSQNVLCPCHNDRNASLTLTKAPNTLLIHCQAGCATADILNAKGLTFADLYDVSTVNVNDWQTKMLTYLRERPPIKDCVPETLQIKGVYDYAEEDGSYSYSKVRLEADTVDGKHEKTFKYAQINYQTGRYSLGAGGKQHTLYNLCALMDKTRISEKVFFVEGEKDVITLSLHGLIAVTAGSVRDWNHSFSKYFTGRDVVVIGDNDAPGRKLSETVATDLLSIASSVRVIIPSKISKGDVTDYLTKEEGTIDSLMKMAEDILPVTNESKTEEIILPKKLSEVTERTVDWLIDGYIPRNGITILAADGGAGKTSSECAFAAAVSSGKRPFLLGEVPRKFEIEYTKPRTVLFLSGEDYAEFTLCKKIRAMGGDLDNISIVDPSDGLLEKCKIGSDYLRKVIDAIKPDLVIIDPLQAFIDRDVNMVMRNQMRQALQPINELASKYGFAVIIAVHSNKRDAVSGRNRVSDSSDIWDMARSVLMVGTADYDSGQRYISHEKSNWSMLSRTVLFNIIEDGCIDFAGYTDKKDMDFQREASQSRNRKKEAPKTQECKDFIVELLRDGTMAAGDLQKAVIDNGWTSATFKRARTELRDEHIIRQERRATGQSRGTIIYWKLSNKVVSL